MRGTEKLRGRGMDREARTRQKVQGETDRYRERDGDRGTQSDKTQNTPKEDKRRLKRWTESEAKTEERHDGREKLADRETKRDGDAG